jgi:hypothetical protein
MGGVMFDPRPAPVVRLGGFGDDSVEPGRRELPESQALRAKPSCLLREESVPLVRRTRILGRQTAD